MLRVVAKDDGAWVALACSCAAAASDAVDWAVVGEGLKVGELMVTLGTVEMTEAVLVVAPMVGPGEERGADVRTVPRLKVNFIHV